MCTSVRAKKRTATEDEEAASGIKKRRLKTRCVPMVEQVWLTVPLAWRKRKAIEYVASEVKRRLVNAQSESSGKV